MEDIKIQRATKTRVIPFNSAIDLPANARRLALRLVMEPNDYLTAGLSRAAVRLRSFSTFNAVGGQPLILTTIFAIYNTVAADPGAAVAKLSDQVTLDDVGIDLMGPLLTEVYGTVTGWLYETYLDTDQVPPIDAGHR